ncbi:hypothetical protein L7F22_054616 [Adiantum nelumboides]|nr:hypothetical protein [Adiantum nelumboides]
MSKRKSVGHHRWRWKLGISFTACILLLVVLKLQQNFSVWPYHDTVSTQWAFPQAPPSASSRNKIAFLFLTRKRMPLDIVWDPFFQEADKDLFSIYIHSRPGFIYNKRTTACQFFNDRQLPNSIQVHWGEASMVKAERLLLGEALKDIRNNRFLLLSDSCVPLYNFSFVYSYLMTTPKSFVDSFSDAKERRYNPRMAPLIQRVEWRKGSQWFALRRDHAAIFASDTDVFPLFQKLCLRHLSPEVWRQKNLSGDPSKQHNCIPDEHYVQTLLAMKGLESEIERRTLTYTLWNQTGKDQGKKGWHPVTFTSADMNDELLSGIKGITSVYYETEDRTEWCSQSGSLRPCFLFARKFTRGAAFRLLNQGNEDSFPNVPMAKNEATVGSTSVHSSSSKSKDTTLEGKFENLDDKSIALTSWRVQYPKKQQFYYTREELHEEHGLRLEGKLYQHLSEANVLEEDWLSIFKKKREKGFKLFLRRMQPEYVEDCKLLFHKVYQAKPANKEITHKFATLFVYEQCLATRQDFAG